MNQWERMHYEMQEKLKKTEIENKKIINSKGFQNEWHYSIYIYLIKTIPHISNLDVSHSTNERVINFKFFNNEIEINIITATNKFEYPEIRAIGSIPEVNKFKDEKIEFYKINKINNEIHKLSYSFITEKVKEQKIEINKLEKDIQLAKENLKKYIDIDLYVQDFNRNIKKYCEIDSLFEKKAIELGNEFIKTFLQNKIVKEIDPIFNKQTLEDKIINYLPLGNLGYSKFRDYSRYIDFGRKISGKILLSKKRINKSIIYFYLFWEKKIFFLKIYIDSIYANKFKEDKIMFIDSIFEELNKDKEKIVDKYLPGNGKDYIDYYSQKSYLKIEKFAIELEKLENILIQEVNIIEECEEELIKEEKRIEDLKNIQNLFK